MSGVGCRRKGGGRKTELMAEYDQVKEWAVRTISHGHSLVQSDIWFQFKACLAEYANRYLVEATTVQFKACLQDSVKAHASEDTVRMKR